MVTDDFMSNDQVNPNGATTPIKRKRKSPAIAKRKSAAKRHPFGMRKCQSRTCGQSFYPTTAWQKFHSRECGDDERHRRQRERYRKFVEQHGTEGRTRAKANGSPREYESVPAREPVPTQSPPERILPARIKALRRVNPRSLEKSPE